MLSRRCVLCNRIVPQGASHCAFDGCAFTYTQSETPADAIVATVPKPPPFKKCPACHKQYDAENNFCSIDGSKLSESTVSTQHDLQPPQIARIIGKTVGGKYVVNSVIGEGGMAVVYQAFDALIERPVVIKVMKSWLANDESANERFKRECQLTAQLNHPNVIRVYDGGLLSDWGPYLVMEYVEGETLRRAIEKQGILPADAACKVMIQILRGLSEAHEMGIIHRDLKPDNILIARGVHASASVKILDFGIAYLVQGAQRLTQTGKLVGTPAYISPEQLKDKAIDARTDVYAVGVILYEMLTGKPPFEAATAESIFAKHLFEMPPPLSQTRPDFKPGTLIESVVMKALEKEPENRYQTAAEMSHAVERAFREMRRKGTLS